MKYQSNSDNLYTQDATASEKLNETAATASFHFFYDCIPDNVDFTLGPPWMRAFRIVELVLHRKYNLTGRKKVGKGIRLLLRDR